MDDFPSRATYIFLADEPLLLELDFWISQTNVM